MEGLWPLYGHLENSIIVFKNEQKRMMAGHVCTMENNLDLVFPVVFDKDSLVAKLIDSTRAEEEATASTPHALELTATENQRNTVHKRIKFSTPQALLAPPKPTAQYLKTQRPRGGLVQTVDIQCDTAGQGNSAQLLLGEEVYQEEPNPMQEENGKRNPCVALLLTDT